MAGMYCLDDLITLAVRQGAEELCIQTGQPPIMVLQGQKRALDVTPLTRDNVAGLFRSFATEQQEEELRRCGDVRFNHSFPNAARFAVAAFMTGEEISLKLKNLGR